MTSPRTISGRVRSRGLALCCTILAAGSWPLQAHANGAVAISVGEPEGFSNLIEEHVLLVDVYFGGVRKGEAKISAAPGTVSFLEPESAIDLLPELTDRLAIEAALAAGNLSANSQLACSSTSDPKECGKLSPEVAGVIFDRDRFRLDVFVNPRFLTIQDNNGEAYLPEPGKGFGVINSFGAVMSGQLGSASNSYNFQDSVIIGSGDRRIRGDLSYASELGFGAERLALEWDHPGLRYSAGALWAPGNEISGRRKLLGVGVETQIDTRRDKDEIFGSPVVVYLEQRARVDVVRDGRVLSSAIYEPGNQQVDTTNLPEGNYDIELRIEEPGRQAREERRFFTKSRRIPSQGRTDFFVFGGTVVADSRRGSLDPSGHPYFQGGMAHRLNEDWAIEGSIEATDEGASAEIGATLLSHVAQLRAAAVVDVAGTYGGILQLASSGTSRFNFNFDLRHIEKAADKADSATPPAGPAMPGDPFDTLDLAGYGESYSQIGGIVSYSIASLRFLGTFFYRDDDAQEARYSIGPSLEWDVLRKGPFMVTLRGDLTATERGSSGFAGISLRLLERNSTLTALGGTRASGIADDDVGRGPVAAVSGAWSPNVAGGELALGAGFEHLPRKDDVVLSTEFRHPLGSFAGDLVHSDGPSSAVTQYSVGFQTTLAAGAGTVQVAGRTTTESMVVARVGGARDADRFEILVNEQVAGTIEGSRPYTLALPAYRAYDVRIRPTGRDLLAYDSSPREVSLYPGTVTKLEWTAAPVTIKFGRLMSPNGISVGGVSITGKGIWTETDDDGYFQIEVPDDAELTVTLQDGSTFAMILPSAKANNGIARIGSVVCCGKPEIRLGALDPFPVPSDRGSQ